MIEATDIVRRSLKWDYRDNTHEMHVYEGVVISVSKNYCDVLLYDGFVDRIAIQELEFVGKFGDKFTPFSVRKDIK